MSAKLPEKNDELDEDFEEHDRIFHYTNGAGLAGILETNCLWATYYQSVNDKREFEVAREILEHFVEKRMFRKIAALKVNGDISGYGSKIKEIIKDGSKSFVTALYDAFYITGYPFIFSGCVCNSRNKDEITDFENGILQHWGIYGKNSGYAIQINPHTLMSSIRNNEQENCDMVGCIKVDYSQGENPPELLKHAFEDVGSASEKYIKLSILENNNHPYNIEITIPFTRIISCLKDPFFMIEREARLILIRMNQEYSGKQPHPIHVRTVDRNLIPYVKILDGSLLNDPSPIERIIVGPGEDIDRRCCSLKAYLQMRGLSKIEVTPSNIPYVPR